MIEEEHELLDDLFFFSILSLLLLATTKEAVDGATTPVDCRTAAPNVAIGALKQMIARTRNFIIVLSRPALALS
jgi:hypothetical protein